MPVVHAPSVPEPSSILLIGAGLIGLLLHWSTRSSSKNVSPFPEFHGWQTRFSRIHQENRHPSTFN